MSLTLGGAYERNGVTSTVMVSLQVYSFALTNQVVARS
jgi:hypothetical protein